MGFQARDREIFLTGWQPILRNALPRWRFGLVLTRAGSPCYGQFD
jgi:hypothetical protein